MRGQRGLIRHCSALGESWQDSIVRPQHNCQEMNQTRNDLHIVYVTLLRSLGPGIGHIYAAPYPATRLLGSGCEAVPSLHPSIE